MRTAGAPERVTILLRLVAVRPASRFRRRSEARSHHGVRNPRKVTCLRVVKPSRS